MSIFGSDNDLSKNSTSQIVPHRGPFKRSAVRKHPFSNLFQNPRMGPITFEIFQKAFDG